MKGKVAKVRREGPEMHFFGEDQDDTSVKAAVFSGDSS